MHVVVVGAGFAGLNAVRALRRSPVDITLIDAHNYHLFQPLLYQVATAGLDGDDIAYPVRGTLRRQRNARFRLGRVQHADLDARHVVLHDGSTIDYDVLVVAIGAVTASFAIPGVDEHTHGLKSLEDAGAIRTELLQRFERASAGVGERGEGGEPHGSGVPGVRGVRGVPGEDAAGVDLDVVIVGGGPTGVELAGGVRELYDKVLAKDFPELDPRGARITLVEATGRVLGTFAPKLSDRAERGLRKRHVDVELGVGVAQVHRGRVELADGRSLRAGTIVWAAGVRANPLAAALGLPVARNGRVLVQDDLTVEGHPEVFVVGDVAASPSEHGAPLPQVAQVAIQGGRHVARTVDARLAGKPAEPFRYNDKGAMATIGRNAAVAELPSGIHLSGPIGWLAWLGLHLVYLIGFRNRANVLVNWAWNYLTYDRGARLIDHEDLDDPRR